MKNSVIQKNVKPFLVAILFLICIGLVRHNNRIEENFLDGCYHVYIDLGTNVGIQIRKLYEPKLYPEAKLHEIFETYFKRNQTSMTHICTVGFEPNPSHEETLKKLSEAYRGCDWNVNIFTRTAVSDREGQVYFYTDHEPENLEWGGNIIGRMIIFFTIYVRYNCL